MRSLQSWDASYRTASESAFAGGEYSFGGAWEYTNVRYSAAYPTICQG